MRAIFTKVIFRILQYCFITGTSNLRVYGVIKYSDILAMSLVAPEMVQ